jgi:DNA-directed RNA polymerase specialized sigma subunit
MSDRESNSARHGELKRRMDEGDNAARWAIAREMAALLIVMFMRKNRAMLRMIAEDGDMESESSLMCFDLVPQWDPSKGALSTFASHHIHHLAMRLIRHSGPVARKGRDYAERMPLTVIRVSGMREKPEDQQEAWDAYVGAAPPPSGSRADCERLVAKAGLSDRQIEVIGKRIDNQLLREIGDEQGVTRERIRQIEGDAMGRLQLAARRGFYDRQAS